MSIVEIIHQINLFCYRKNKKNDTKELNNRIVEDKWWVKKNLVTLKENIIFHTNFLPVQTKITDRIRHITAGITSIKKCHRTECNNNSTWQGNMYAKYCSYKCNAIDNARYGKDNYFGTDAGKNKIKEICIEKYGVDNFSKTGDFTSFMKNWHETRDDTEKQSTQLKREETNIERYGTKTPFLNETVKEKIKTTMIEKYGVESPLQSSDILQKTIETNLARYGKKNFLQQHISTDHLAGLESKEWVEKQLLLMSTKQLAEITNSSYSGICQKIKKLGIDLTKYSYFEKEVKLFIDEILPGPNAIIELNNNSMLNKKHIDIYLPELKYGIECDGVYWHIERNGKPKNYHVTKTNLAEQKGIKLVHIFENEWQEKTNIVKNRIKIDLGITEIFYARKCTVQKLSTNQEKEFLEENHLQGYVSSRIAYGLFYGNELISVMTFGKSRFDKKMEWELYRLATKNNYSVTGGSAKLFSAFIKEHNPSNIISYCDRRWFTGNVYKSLGFEFSHNSNPNYFYLENNGTLSSRQKYQKNKLKNILENFDPALTEWDNMQAHGYDRIWDCGNSVWKWNSKKSIK